MTSPALAYSPHLTMPLLLAAAEVWAFGFRGNGWPVPARGETHAQYMARVFPGTTWRPHSSDPLTAAIETAGNIAIDFGLDVATPIAGLVGAGGQVQAVKAVVDSGLAADKQQALSSGTGAAIHYQPPGSDALLRILLGLGARQNAAKAPSVSPSPPKARHAMNITIGIPKAAAQALAQINPSGGWAQSLNASDELVSVKAPLPPPPTPWYNKKLAGPVTVGEAGIGAALLGVLAKVML